MTRDEKYGDIPSDHRRASETMVIVSVVYAAASKANGGRDFARM